VDVPALDDGQLAAIVISADLATYGRSEAKGIDPSRFIGATRSRDHAHAPAGRTA
jgi:hypothetical protein